MYNNIEKYCSELSSHYSDIPQDRKLLLQKISDYIRQKRVANEVVSLVYICTHNSRRSHFGQVWGAVAAAYYKLSGIRTYSGGTEATAFHPNAIAALERVGFTTLKKNESANPLYEVGFSENSYVSCFSKMYDDAANPKQNFVAIMTCSDAEENCPFIPGVDLRIGTTYNDPKVFDNTAQQNSAYDERCRQIALETLYVFSLV